MIGNRDVVYIISAMKKEVQQFMKRLKGKKCHLRALILINTEDKYQLVDSGASKIFQDLECPIIIIKKTDGQKIMQLIKNEECSASIIAETSVDDFRQSKLLGT